MKKGLIRHTREGGYPGFLKKNGFPATASGMTAYKHFRMNEEPEMQAFLHRWR
jgi:hypothetical protein